mmetsp:Transcript_7688/g.14295  ORF Transcript_7688/g.14295 Transcript_7688/m.14295 type:complete len:199 (-) Transcript_7688:1551-2147(-)
MVTLKLFRRPTREQQEEVLAAASKRGFNYDARGGTKKLDDEEEVKAFKSNGYRVCSRKVRVGEGWGTYRKAKSKLKDWRQVQLGWTSVLPDTPVKKGAEVCLCARVLGVWIMNPLKTVYVQTKRTRMPIVNLVPMLPLAYNSAQFSHAEGTMKGHLLVRFLAAFPPLFFPSILLQQFFRARNKRESRNPNTPTPFFFL